MTTDEPLRDLISAAGGDDRALRRAVAALGAPRTAQLLVDELFSRADLHEVPLNSPDPVEVEFRFTLDGAVVVHRAFAGLDGGGHAAGPAENPQVRVELGLTAAARAVFGPAGVAGSVPRRVRWRDIDVQSAFLALADARSVTHRLLRGLTVQPVDLDELSLRMGSDKWGTHYYTQHYQRHFAPLRDRCLTVLELGIGGFGDPAAGGGSLRMWKRLFRRAMIYGVDIFDKSGVDEQRIRTVQGDFADPVFLAGLAERTGPVDIIIDDGSHHNPDVLTAFEVLYPHLAPDGLYVIEDLQTAYWPGYAGQTGAGSRATSMGMLKTLVDGLNHEEFEPAGEHRASETDRTLVGAHFYHNLAVLEKGWNAEGTIPAWMGRNRLSQEQMAAIIFPLTAADRLRSRT